METFDALERMKTQLTEMTSEQFETFILNLSALRQRGPAKVERSSRTGAPKGGRAVNKQARLLDLLSNMTEEERVALLNGLVEIDTEAPDDGDN